MTISLGIFDLLTYAVPGALQLTVLLYLGQRLSWLDLSKLLVVPSGVLFVGLAVASYLLGHIVYRLGRLFDLAARQGRDAGWERAKSSFLALTPDARSRPFVHRDQYLLLAALELHAREVAVEISRFRAAGLMLRGSALPLTAGGLVALAEAVTGPRKLEAAAVASLLALSAFLALQRSLQLRGWARSKTLQLAYWVPGIDEPPTHFDAARPQARSEAHAATPTTGGEALAE